MIFFFGTRASKIKERKIRRTTCSYCQTQDSFTVSTYSKYFHFFWIPIIPFSKTHVAECSHCKKSYAQHEFTPAMNLGLQKENDINPAKRPIWQGAGCIVLLLLFILPFIFTLFTLIFGTTNETGTTLNKDIRREYLKEDMNQLSLTFDPIKDSISVVLKECVDYDVENGIDTDKIKYFTKVAENKLIVLLEVRDMKQIESSERKIMIDVIEDCLYAMPNLEAIDEYYIGVEGKWSTLLIKTPYHEDLSGKFADQNKLLDFYGEMKKDSTILSNTNKTDSLRGF